MVKNSVSGVGVWRPGLFQGTVASVIAANLEPPVEPDEAEARARLESIVACSQDAIVTRDLDGTITSWNPSAERIYGYTAEEAIGRNIRLLLPADLAEDDTAKVTRLAYRGRVEHYETRRVRRDGSVVHVAVTMSPIRDGNGQMVGISTISRDISDRVRFQRQIARLSSEDGLTGLNNRRRFEDELVSTVARSRRFDLSVAVVVIDLDDFKFINDTFGQYAGDLMLQMVGQMVDAMLPPRAMLARLGGDQFAILLTDITWSEVRDRADLLLEGIRELALRVGGDLVRVTASIGFALLDDADTTAEELLADADRAMYSSKEAGRDRVTGFSRESRLKRRDRGMLGWARRIREALEKDDGFELYSQPILDLDSWQVSQHELLVRMRGENGELIPPASFLPVAERHGLVHAIDRWVVSQAIGLLKIRPDLRLEVNVSGTSVDDPQLQRLIRSELADPGIDPSSLIFEITETAAIASLDSAREFAEALRELGCGFALDDFGTGFGTFRYLKHVPVDLLKIDGDFVSTPRSPTDELVVSSMVDIAKGLGMRTVAEFVEDPETLDFLLMAGVDFAQGYHIGHPAPVKKLLEGTAEPDRCG